MITTGRYTFGTSLAAPFEAVRSRVVEALRAEGFGVLTEIDVQATFKEKLDLDREPYLILGACNPQLASRAIEADPSAGALLPCNVVLRTVGPATIVEIMDPNVVLGIASAPGLVELAAEARVRLGRVVDSLNAAT